MTGGELWNVEPNWFCVSCIASALPEITSIAHRPPNDGVNGGSPVTYQWVVPKSILIALPETISGQVFVAGSHGRPWGLRSATAACSGG